MNKLIHGKIIRILDKRTAIINLGSDHGIIHESVFSIRGTPEDIVDPETGEVLGRLSVVKAKLKASQVYPKFTVATTRWTVVAPKLGSFGEAIGLLFENKVVDQGEMAVSDDQIQPWSVESEESVRVGDGVEVTVDIHVTPSLEEPKSPRFLLGGDIAPQGLEEEDQDDSAD